MEEEIINNNISQKQSQSQNLLDSTENILQELSCIICSDIFHQPVTLNCGHSFCKGCISKALSIQPLCPICKCPNLSDPKNLKENLIMRNLVEGTKQHAEREKKENQKIEEQYLQKIQEQHLNNVNDKDSNEINSKPVQEFKNLFIIWIKNEHYFFPNNNDEIVFQMKITSQQFQSICPDWYVCIGFQANQQKIVKDKEDLSFITSKVQLMNIQSLGNNIFKSKITIKERIQIKRVKQLTQEDFQIQGDKNLINGSGQQNSNNFSNQEQQFSLELADGVYIEDDLQSLLLQEQKQELQRIQGLAKNILETIDYIIKNNLHNQENGSMMDFTSQTIIEKLQNLQFYNLYENRDNLSMNQLSQISFTFPGIFNINGQMQKRIFSTEQLLERMVLFFEHLTKSKEIHNVNVIFRLSTFGSGESLFENLYSSIKDNLWLFVIIIALILGSQLK